MKAIQYLSTTALASILIACGGGGSDTPEAVEPIVETANACIIDDPRRNVGDGMNAPGRLEVDFPPVQQASGACGDNQQYLMGTGIHDITGVIGNTSGAGWENPFQVFTSLHTRLYARAFALGSECNDKSLIFVSADIGLMRASIRRGVLEAVANHEVLAQHYNADNIMLSATHTHSGPAGYSEGTDIFHYGNDTTVYNVIVDGIVAAIEQAHSNKLAQPAGRILLNTGELLNTNINRSKPAFVLNPEDERNAFLNERGEVIDTNKRVVQLDLMRRDNPIGLINWFGVHPTIIGPTQPTVSSDMKGFASLGFEQVMGTNYLPAAGEDNFVAAFAQADEGDSSPNILIEEFPHPDPRRGGGVDDFDSNAISGIKQLAKAMELFQQGDAVTGPVDYRLLHIPINNIVVEDPVVLNRLAHPAELDADVIRTCAGALGVSFGAGAEDGQGPTVEGIKCSDDFAIQEAAFNDLAVALEARGRGFPGGWPAETIPAHTLAAVAMCNVDELGFVGDFDCQAEKPVFLPTGRNVLPIQLFRVGNFALLGLPWEVTTISARRLRSHLLEVLAPVGVDTLVIAGLVNDYVHYLTTREEYAAQQYEGASNLFGPWSLAAVTQESLKLARAVASGTALERGPDLPSAELGQERPAYNPTDGFHPQGEPGTLITDAPEMVSPGDDITIEFVAGHPRNDMRIQQSYAQVERMAENGEWQIAIHDRDPRLLYHWDALIPAQLPIDPAIIGPSSARVVWQVPLNLPAGQYRIRYFGAAQASPLSELTPYEGSSREFTLAEPVSECADYQTSERDPEAT